MDLKIVAIKYGSIYFDDLIRQELLLWPDNEYNELYEETKESKDYYFGSIFEDKFVGFIQISIRHEYVNGTTTSPVGFIEGIFVEEEYRTLGIGKKLMEYAFYFVKQKGCMEIASDALIDNKESHEFHMSVGFKETERVVYFSKKLD